jgi:hypothetical protein
MFYKSRFPGFFGQDGGRGKIPGSLKRRKLHYNTTITPRVKIRSLYSRIHQLTGDYSVASRYSLLFLCIDE